VVELAAAVEESARAQVVLAECTVLVVGIVIERYPGIGPGEVPLLPPASSYGDIVPVGHVFRDPEAVDVLRLDKLLPEKGHLGEHRLLAVIYRVKLLLE